MLRCLYFLFVAVMIEVLAQVPCMVGQYGLGFYGIPIQGINVLFLFGVPFCLPFVYPIVLAHVVMV